jgi:hypothetical protein
VLSLLLALLAPAHAAPGVVPIQGVLTDSAGAPVDGDVSVTFRLVTNDTGSIEVWTDTVTVSATDGRFAVDLGAGAALDLQLFADHPDIHLGIAVESDSEMAFVPMDHVPYAAWAEDAGKLGGQTATAFEASILAETDARYLSTDYLPQWGSLVSMPAGFADGVDNDTTYSGSDFAVSNQSCGAGEFIYGLNALGGLLCQSATVNEADLTALLDDNYLGTDYTPAFSDLTGVPTGLADGDDDTTYTAGLGLEMVGNELFISEYAGGPLIPNPRFESGTTGWTLRNTANSGGSVVTVTDGQAGTAVYANDNQKEAWIYSDARVAIRPAQTYRVSGSFRRTETLGNAGRIYLAVVLFDSSGNVIGGDGFWWFYPVSAETLTDTEWRAYSAEFGAGDGPDFPANAATMSVGAILNYNTSTVPGNRNYQVTNLQLKAVDAPSSSTSPRFAYVDDFIDYRNNGPNSGYNVWRDVTGRTITYTKQSSDSLLRIAYQDTLGTLGSNYDGCRWRILVNGASSAVFSAGDDQEGAGWNMQNATHTAIVPDIPRGTVNVKVQNQIRYGTECLSGWNSVGEYLSVEEL